MLQSLRSKVFTAGRAELTRVWLGTPPPAPSTGLGCWKPSSARPRQKRCIRSSLQAASMPCASRAASRTPSRSKISCPVSPLSWESYVAFPGGCWLERERHAATARGVWRSCRSTRWRGAFFRGCRPVASMQPPSIPPPLLRNGRVCANRSLRLASPGDQTTGRVPDYYSENSSTLVKMLMSVAGALNHASTRPVMSSFRICRNAAAPRGEAFLQQVTLRHRGKNSAVIAKDISATGLGLDRVPELKLEELVQIEMTGGRRLMGMVVWIRGSSCRHQIGQALAAQRSAARRLTRHSSIHRRPFAACALELAALLFVIPAPQLDSTCYARRDPPLRHNRRLLNEVVKALARIGAVLLLGAKPVGANNEDAVAGQARPARRSRRTRTSGGRLGERRTSNLSSTAVATLLTFWPPGPEARMNCS